MHCWCLSFSKPLHCKTNRFFAEYDDVFFNFGDNIGRFFFTKISEELFISPKSVGGNLLYSGDEQNVFFSVIKSVLKSSLNSVQSYRNKKIRVKKCHWIQWKKMWFTEKGDEACTEFGDKKGNSQNSVMNSSQAGIAHIYETSSP